MKTMLLSLACSLGFLALAGCGGGRDHPVVDLTDLLSQSADAAREEVDCLDLPVADCAAQGCTVFEAKPYDPAAACYAEQAAPAFCQADPDIVCGWQGDPIILTEPDGTRWYIGWSCFSTPADWAREYVSEGRPVCEEEEVPCLDLPVEECAARGCTVFEAHPYDPDAGCFEGQTAPAFCQADPDIVCGWEGDPIILTEPDGTSWYIDWSCFSTPADWAREYVPGGEPACE